MARIERLLVGSLAVCNAPIIDMHGVNDFFLSFMLSCLKYAPGPKWLFIFSKNRRRIFSLQPGFQFFIFNVNDSSAAEFIAVELVKGGMCIRRLLHRQCCLSGTVLVQWY